MKSAVILILSSDTLFAEALREECAVAGVAARILPTPDVSVADADAVLLDLDCIRSVPVPMKSAIGFSKHPERASALKTECRILFLRPFLMSDFRAELVRMLCPDGETPVAPPPHRTGGALRLDGDSRTVIKGDASVTLTPAEFTLLDALMRADGEVVDGTALRSLLGSAESNVLEVTVSHLRRKIEKPWGIRLVESVRGKGYRYRAV